MFFQLSKAAHFLLSYVLKFWSFYFKLFEHSRKINILQARQWGFRELELYVEQDQGGGIGGSLEIKNEKVKEVF